MFGSGNAFGQSSNSPFMNTSVFGQTNSVNNKPFTPQPFGTSPFGAQTGSSIFGGTSTGVFGATQASSPIASTSAFGASSTPTFGSSAFGSSSAPAFGSGSSAFGGSSMFGQKPAFGGFGSTASQASPFGSTFQQSQPAFGSNVFGYSSPFGASSQPSFGATSTPPFGATSAPAFGATSAPAFGSASAPAFGAASTPSFGATSAPAFGSTTTPTFGTTASAFGSTSSPAFGTSGTTAFGASGTSVFGSSATPAFGSSSSTFGASSNPSVSFGSSGAFGQSASTFGSSPFGSSPSPFGGQSSPFGSQTTFSNVGFGQSAFGNQPGGSRVAPYAPTPEAEGGTAGTQPAGKLESISAMPVYKDKSHEELRWEDYQRGDKGGPNPTSQPVSGIGFGTSLQSSPFAASTTFGHTAGSPFSSTINSNPFASKPLGSTGFPTSSAPAFSSPFGTSSSTPFSSSTPSTASTLFGPATPSAFGISSSPSLFGSSTTPTAFGTSPSPSIFGSAPAPGTNSTFGPGLNFGNTQSSGLFQSPAPSIGQTTPVFSSTMAFGQTTTSSFNQRNPFGPSTGIGGNLFTGNSTPSLFNANHPSPFGQTTSGLSTSFPAPTQTSGSFAFGNFGQSQPASFNIGSGSGFAHGAFGQSTSAQNNVIAQPTTVINPFGTLPAMPQMSIGCSGSAPSIQYGICSMPIPDKPAPVRVSALVTTRNFPQRRIRLAPRNYHPRSDSPKIPFFSDEDGPSTPKADALFIPRENPRALVIRSSDRPSRPSAEKQQQTGGAQIHENGMSSEDRPAASLNGVGACVHNDYDTEALDKGGISKQYTRCREKSNGIHHEENGQKGESYIRFSGQRAGEAAIVYEHGADIEALMPKLRHVDYYTEPRIQELAVKERADPGFCRRVKDFVVGRHGYGSIKFIGETDVRRLDLESLIQFNSKEVIVYVDESKKPPVGQGLNKPAEVTLLNIKCFNKKNGQQYTDGPKVEKYKEMLMKKAQDQGAEFVVYDPVQGEWKFRVNHFSQYEFVNFCADDVDTSFDQCN